MVTEVVLIEDNDLLLRVEGAQIIKLLVPRGNWHTTITDLQEAVDLICVITHQLQRTMHVTWKPVHLLAKHWERVHNALHNVPRSSPCSQPASTYNLLNRYFCSYPSDQIIFYLSTQMW